jgi:hypothetical protein
LNVKTAARCSTVLVVLSYRVQWGKCGVH